MNGIYSGLLGKLIAWMDGHVRIAWKSNECVRGDKSSTSFSNTARKSKENRRTLDRLISGEKGNLESYNVRNSSLRKEKYSRIGFLNTHIPYKETKKREKKENEYKKRKEKKMNDPHTKRNRAVKNICEWRPLFGTLRLPGPVTTTTTAVRNAAEYWMKSPAGMATLGLWMSGHVCFKRMECYVGEPLL